MPPIQNQKISVTHIVIVVCVLIGLSLAAYLVWQRGSTGPASMSPAQSAALVSADKRMAIGTIESISGQEITLKNVQKVSPGLSAGSVSSSTPLTVAIDPATSIQRLVPKDPTLFQEEQAAFLKKVQALGTQGTTTPLISPEPFTRETIALKDLKAGDTILAYANENIAELDTFTAVKIEIQTSKSQ